MKVQNMNFFRLLKRFFVNKETCQHSFSDWIEIYIIRHTPSGRAFRIPRGYRKKCVRCGFKVTAEQPN